MDDQFKIFVDRLKNGKVEDLKRSFSPAFLELDESDLKFSEDIALSGEAYLADQELLLHINTKAMAQIPCSICNEQVDVPINVEGAYHAEPIENIKSGVFYLKDVLREIILLETPKFIECNNGKCPMRKSAAKYMKAEEENYQPFKDLTIGD